MLDKILMQIAAASSRQDQADVSAIPLPTGLTTAAKAVYTGLAQLSKADVADFSDVAPADIAKISMILRLAGPETGRTENAVAAETAIQQATLAINEGRFEQAIGYIASAVTRDPSRLEDFRARPELTPIRTSLDQLVDRATQVAKIRAESDLSRVEQVMDKAGWPKLTHWDTRPEVLVRLARQLFEAGGYVNYVRSADLAYATFQSAYWETLAPPPQLSTTQKALIDSDPTERLQPAPPVWQTLRSEFPAMVRAIWDRAPLLVLFFAWLTLGSLAGLGYALIRIFSPAATLQSLGDVGFSIWALGFLALVGLGFFAKIKTRRR